jgi:hypothetical protein
MIYYLIFCITTCIVTMIRCQIPAWRAVDTRRFNFLSFWIAMILSNLILAPIHFVVLLSASDLYKQDIIRRLSV